MALLVQELLRVVERLRDEAKTATRSWTLIEAYMGRDEDHRQNLRAGLGRAGLGMTTHVIIKALARDVLSALFRATDERSQNSLTFCTLSALLNDVSAREAIENYIRSEAPDWQVESSVRESAKCTEQLLLLVPPTWKKPPQDTSLLKLRAKLKPVRDSLLSHSLDYANVQQPTFDETREFLRIVNELQRCASRVLYASTDPLQTRWDVALREGHRFWDVVEIGVSENLADPRLGP